MGLVWLTAVANSLWIGGGCTMLAWCVTRSRLRLNAATRYGIWWTALGLVVALPPMMYLSSARPGRPSVTLSVPPMATEALSRVEENASSAAAVDGPAQRSDASAATLELPFTIPAPASLPALAIAAWGLGALLGMLRLAVEAIRLWRFRGRCSPADEDLQRRLDEWIRQSRTTRDIQLAISNEARGPVAIGFAHPAIVMPAALISELSPAELDQILLHELAHLRRGDDWARLLQRTVEALLFFHPAVPWIGRNLDLEREIACDDRVIAATGQRREYASCLARVVELSGFRRRWSLSTGAAESRSHLIRRIELMLDKTRNRTLAISRPAMVVVTLAAVVAGIAAGRLPSVLAFASEAGQETRVPPPPPPRMHGTLAAAPVSPVPPANPSGDSRWRSFTSDHDHTLELRVDGTVEFADDDHDLKSLSPNGRFLMETNSGGQIRRYEVRADSGGRLTKSYLVDGRSRNFEEARAWLAGTLPEVIRESAAGAGPRIQRIAEHGGPIAAIREIGLIRSDGSKRVYLQELIDRVHLDDGQLSETLRLVRGIASDGEKTRAIIHSAPRYLKGGLRQSLFEAVDTIHSDGERHRALAAVLRDDPGNQDTALLVSKSAAHISSDGEKAAVLVQVATAGVGTDEIRRAWLRAAATIRSDGEKRRVLSTLLAGAIRPADLGAVLRTAADMISDGEKASVLIEAARLYSDAEAVRRPFFDVANSLHSDGEHVRVLLAVLQRSTAPATLSDAAHSAQRIASDGEKGRVLSRIARESLTDANVRRSFFEALDSLHSDGERARALIPLIGRPGVSDEIVIASVRSAARMHSDGEKSNLLMQAAQNYGRSRGVAQEVRVALRTVSSAGEYRRVMTALERVDPTI